MRVYQLEYLPAVEPGADLNFTRTREWFGSEREAVVRRLELFKSSKIHGKKKDAEIWPVDIPTDKLGLLAFLRKECV
jgi:hypothetical protein